MKSPEVGPEFQPSAESTVQVPVSELLQNPVEAARLWPEYSVIEQVKQHSADISAVCSVIDCLPNATMSLEDALGSGYITKKQTSSFYTTLSTIIGNPDYQRLVLYLPFEFLPDATWEPSDPILKGSIDHFTSAYMRAWRSLLEVHDVRANFVDGDILESEQLSGNHPRVVKAAHLIPELVERGLLTKEDISELLQTDDMILRQSVNEALSLLYEIPLSFPARTLALVDDTFTERRRAWLAQERRERSILSTAEHIAAALQDGEPPQDLIEALLVISDPDTASQTFAEGMYQAIVTSPDSKQAKLFYLLQQPLLEDEWYTGSAEVKDRLASVFRRLFRSGIASLDDVNKLGINVPPLSGPFSENFPELSADLQTLSDITETIESNAKLREFILPAVIVGGSKLKGYGGLTSDVDVSVFIKPDTPTEAQEYIRKQLDTLFARYEPIEFWLQNDGNQLKIQDFSEPDIHTADSYWTHILFGGAWVGNPQVLTMLQQKLLPQYFHETPETVDGVNKRQLYLERLEQDVLQYRLLHKGYQKHYPLQYDPNKTIDKSIFWDPGYRQLATMLFVSNVFLPKIA